MPEPSSSHFNEIPVICDENGWIWRFLHEALSGATERKITKISSQISLRQSWNRFKQNPRIIIHWEGKYRPGGALIEEILEINPLYDVAENIIVVTSAPIREDVVYLSELGVARIIRLRHKQADMRQAARELKKHLAGGGHKNPTESAWGKIQRALNFLTAKSPPEHIAKIQSAIERVQSPEARMTSARYLDAIASVYLVQDHPIKAEQMWRRALEVNPNYFRAHNNLIKFYQEQKQPRLALDLLQRMHSLNKNKIGRLTDFGHAYLQLKDDFKAEHYFKLALDRDNYCSGALNGLAEIRFRHGDLEEARQLLSRTTIAYKFAAQLNRMGIELVKLGLYEDALLHYTKAQYVLPQKEKGPKLFYNIGLCYVRWKKPDIAREFLKIALVKQPGYKKAEELIDRISRPSTSTAA